MTKQEFFTALDGPDSSRKPLLEEIAWRRIDGVESKAKDQWLVEKLIEELEGMDRADMEQIAKTFGVVEDNIAPWFCDLCECIHTEKCEALSAADLEPQLPTK